MLLCCGFASAQEVQKSALQQRAEADNEKGDLRREGSEAERGGRLVEMKLAEIGLVARIGPRAADKVYMEMHSFPFARRVRELRAGLDFDVGGMFPQKLGQELGDSDKPEPGELDRQIRQPRFFVFLDGIFRVVQGSGHRMRTESGELATAGACP